MIPSENFTFFNWSSNKTCSFSSVHHSQPTVHAHTWLHHHCIVKYVELTNLSAKVIHLCSYFNKQWCLVSACDALIHWVWWNLSSLPGSAQIDCYIADGCFSADFLSDEPTIRDCCLGQSNGTYYRSSGGACNECIGMYCYSMIPSHLWHHCVCLQLTLIATASG